MKPIVICVGCVPKKVATLSNDVIIVLFDPSEDNDSAKVKDHPKSDFIALVWDGEKTPILTLNPALAFAFQLCLIRTLFVFELVGDGGYLSLISQSFLTEETGYESPKGNQIEDWFFYLTLLVGKIIDRDKFLRDSISVVSTPVHSSHRPRSRGRIHYGDALEDYCVPSVYPLPAMPPAALAVQPEPLEETANHGSILWTLPERMRVNRRERVEVRIGDQKVVETQLRAGLRGRGLPVIDKLEVSPRMRVTLVGDTKDFVVLSLSSSDQLMKSGTPARWDFDVTPLRSGRRTLKVLVVARVVYKGKDELVDLPSYEREVRISVAPLHSTGRFLGENWKWVTGSIVIPLAVWGFSHTEAGIRIGKMVGYINAGTASKANDPH